MAVQLQKFIETHQPMAICQQANPSKIVRYKSHLPDPLLELWQEVGFGLYAGGLIQIIDPDLYRENLWGWLMRENGDMSRLPIAISAFGDIFYYRKLSEDGDEDVSFIDPHTSETGVLAWSLEEFFNEWCCDRESIADFLNGEMFRDAVSDKGALGSGQIFYFVPALRLGGKRSLEKIDRGDAVIQLDILLQLALG